MIIEKINDSKDVKKLNSKERNILAKEIRDALIQKVSKHGGHFGPNLGIVEATIALHYVFDSPNDKFVFDVSHQCYPHKMLTGRKEAFLNEEKYDDVSGYTNPNESPHDHFIVGHTSTSISLACGLAKGRDLHNGNENIIAIIGDGSLSGGEALEGLNVAGEMDSKLIIVVNDNDMSIAENHGGLYKNLEELRNSNGKGNNLFKAMGLDYIFVKEGNNIDSLIQAFSEAKNKTKPIVVHIATQKGLGYEKAMVDKETWHWSMPFDISTGKLKINNNTEDYGSLTAKYLLDKMQNDNTIMAITSGTPTVFGFDKENRKKAGKQFIDVGIAEETAIALASGIAKNGGKPVYGVYSSFIQRTYDQISQDVCINNSPVTILVYTGSIYGMTDVTHLGLYDISMLSNIPNLVYLSPVNYPEYIAMLNWSIEQKSHPVVIRVPISNPIITKEKDMTNYSIINKYKMIKRRNHIAIIAAGNFFKIGEELAERTNATLINPCFLSGIDKEMLNDLAKDHEIIITLEDGILNGGFGEKIASYYGPNKMRVLNYGLKKEFLDRYNANEIMKECHINVEQIIQDLKTI